MFWWSQPVLASRDFLCRDWKVCLSAMKYVVLTKDVVFACIMVVFCSVCFWCILLSYFTFFFSRLAVLHIRLCRKYRAASRFWLLPLFHSSGALCVCVWALCTCMFGQEKSTKYCVNDQELECMWKQLLASRWRWTYVGNASFPDINVIIAKKLWFYGKLVFHGKINFYGKFNFIATRLGSFPFVLLVLSCTWWWWLFHMYKSSWKSNLI